MRILYISQYFPPEFGGTSDRAIEMARGWVTAGHRVTILCQIPNHPTGVVPAKYRRKLMVRELQEGMEILRLRATTTPTDGGRWGRLLNYLSFMLIAGIIGSVMARRPFDLIYASSPPLFVGAAALFIKSVRQVPMVFEVRDLWPQAVSDLGVFSSRWVVRAAEGLASRCYRGSRRVVAVSEAYREPLLAAGVSPQHLLVVPNGSNPDRYRFDATARMRLRDDLGVESEFTAIFAGLHGLSYDLHGLLDVADRMGSGDFCLVLIGEGPAKPDVRREASRRGLKNVIFLEGQPREEIPAYLSMADVALVPHRDIEVNRLSVPVRIFDAMSCERPVLLAGCGEAARLIEESGGGLAVSPSDPDAIVRALRTLAGDPARRTAMGRRGRAFVKEHHDRRTLARQLIGELVKIESTSASRRSCGWS